MAQLIRCDRCGARYTEAPEYCTVCGADPFVGSGDEPARAPVPEQRAGGPDTTVAAVRHCPGCDLPTPPGTVTCDGCGASVPELSGAHVELVLPGGSVVELVEQSEIVLGRSSEHGVVANSLEELPGVSRRHARLRHRGDTLELTDLGSTNGTFVDDVAAVPGRAWPANRTVRIRLGASGLIQVRPSTRSPVE